MPRLIRDFGLIASLGFAAAAGSASPLQSKLLPLVPEGAQIVAGIEDPHNPTSTGRLLLVTRSTNLDFADWMALSAVDPHQEADEVIEVAASSPEGDLDQHLLLVAGFFDRKRIFRAARQNGASLTEYHGESILVVEPFARERDAMRSERWMAILEGRTVLFGSPELVRKGMDRSNARSTADSFLLSSLSRIHSDVNCWNVLAMSAPILARHVRPGQLHASWTHMLDGADELTIGIHYGSNDRIDFAVHAVSTQNANYIVGILGQPHILLADLKANIRPRLENLSIRDDRVRGSFVLPSKQFDVWLASIYRDRSLNTPPHSQP